MIHETLLYTDEDGDGRHVRQENHVGTSDLTELALASLERRLAETVSKPTSFAPQKTLPCLKIA